MNGEYCYFCKRPMGNSNSEAFVDIHGMIVCVKAHQKCDKSSMVERTSEVKDEV